jgi:hypothetical protein
MAFTQMNSNRGNCFSGLQSLQKFVPGSRLLACGIGNTGVITRVFNGLEVITRCGTFCRCEYPGSAQAVDPCGA